MQIASRRICPNCKRDKPRTSYDDYNWYVIDNGVCRFCDPRTNKQKLSDSKRYSIKLSVLGCKGCGNIFRSRYPDKLLCRKCSNRPEYSFLK